MIFSTISRFVTITVLLALTGCAAIENQLLSIADSEAVDISKYKTFNVEASEIIDKEANAYFNQTFKKLFIEKGLKHSIEQNDILVKYILLTKEEKRLVPIGPGINPYPTWMAEFFGGIKIQIIDSNTQDIIWTGSANRNVTYNKDKINKEQIENDLRKILKPVQSSNQNIF